MDPIDPSEELSDLDLDLERHWHLRALVSDTSPVDVPIIYSSFHLYDWVATKLPHVVQPSTKPWFSLLDELLTKLILPKTGVTNLARGITTIPLDFVVQTSTTKQRTLSLPHPASQIQWCTFYREMAGKIIEHCSNDSGVSLRYPTEVSPNDYQPGEQENDRAQRLQDDGVENTNEAGKYRHLTSHFTYAGYSKGHRFLHSDEFTQLEQTYSRLTRLDISDCFGSIYTHSISWAINGKRWTKTHINESKQTFAGKFDQIISSANWAETNGIVVGPEFSRLFAEVLLQQIDVAVLAAERGEDAADDAVPDFELRRYIDDYYIFTNSAERAERVGQTIQTQLKELRLVLNDAKASSIARPFITKAGVANLAVSRAVDELLSALVSSSQEEPDSSSGFTAKVLGFTRARRLRQRFLLEVRAAAWSAQGYSLVAAYTLGCLSRKLIELSTAPSDHSTLLDAYNLLLELCFFFLSVDYSAPNSIRVCNACLHLYRALPQDSDAKAKISSRLRQLVFELCSAQQVHRKTPALPVATSNMVALLATVDPLSNSNWPKLRTIITKSGHDLSSSGYFGITAGLFYLRDRPASTEAIEELVLAARKIVETEQNAHTKPQHSSVYVHLILDLLSCPFITTEARHDLYSLVRQQLSLPPHSKPMLLLALRYLEQNPIFTDWKDPDLQRSFVRRRQRLEFSYA